MADYAPTAEKFPFAGNFYAGVALVPGRPLHREDNS
jgi:hypothetical protein